MFDGEDIPLNPDRVKVVPALMAMFVENDICFEFTISARQGGRRQGKKQRELMEKARKKRTWGPK